MSAKPIPEGYHTVTPFLTVRGGAQVIDFLQKAFGAQMVQEPFRRPDGKIMHAEVKIGDSRVMIADEDERDKATTSSHYLYVPNVDTVYQQAVGAGGKPVTKPMDMFYGDRTGCVKDSSGNSWTIATHIEDVARADLAKRAEAFMKEHKHRAA